MNNVKSAGELHKDRQKLWDSSIENHVKYINATTGLIDEKYTEYRVCPACGCDNNIKIFYKEGGTYVKCLNCSMVFINPVMKDEYLNEYYANNHAVQSELVTMDNEFYSKIYNQGIDIIKECGLHEGKLLDFGCSAGAFLDIAGKLGFNTYGIELNKIEAGIATGKGHCVYNLNLFDIDFDTKFDVITLWDVFEHLKNGAMFLNTFKEIMNVNGVIFMQIPSSGSLAAQIMQKKCNMFDGLEHVNLFSPDSLNKFLNMHGFRIDKIKTVISEINVLNNYLNYENPYSGSMSATKEILKGINEEYILNNMLGYKMQVAIKIK